MREFKNNRFQYEVVHPYKCMISNYKLLMIFNHYKKYVQVPSSLHNLQSYLKFYTV